MAAYLKHIFCIFHQKIGIVFKHKNDKPGPRGEMTA